MSLCVRKICECPKHCGRDRRTRPMTDFEYRRRTRYGRLLYCDACAEREPPRVIGRGRVMIMPDEWLALLEERP